MLFNEVLQHMLGYFWLMFAKITLKNTRRQYASWPVGENWTERLVGLLMGEESVVGEG